MLLCLALAAIAVAAPSARAGADELQIREIYAGGEADDSYVMLQAPAPGMNQVTGYTLRAYSHTGTVLGTRTFQNDLPNGEGQMTILIADSAYATGFPDGPEPDLTMEKLDLQIPGGAVCWEVYDCVSWGNFSGVTPSPAGTPAPAVGGGQRAVITRDISRGCPGALDADDDSDDSSADFNLLIPANPRDNATPTLETECDAPTAVIDTGPAKETASTSAAFSFRSIPAGEGLECRLRGEHFTPCPAGTISYANLPEGLRLFQVRARDGTAPAGHVRAYSWEVDLTPPVATIDAPKLPNPSPDPTATFYFSADEDASFECSLAPAGSPDDYEVCSTQKLYAGLADGEYVFRVRATDTVGHVGDPVSYPFEVDSTLLDRVPPETTIVLHPPDPSDATSATFTFRSSEPRSMFECRFDDGAFELCQEFGITFEHLSAGRHTFEVRARDEKANTDKTPATYSFTSVFAPVSTVPLVRPLNETVLTTRPRAKSRDRTPTFAFDSPTAGAPFQCQLDGRAFKACESPFTAGPLAYGKHTFRVISLDNGVPDATPAGCSFEVTRPRPAHRRHPGRR